MYKMISNYHTLQVYHFNHSVTIELFENYRNEDK